MTEQNQARVDRRNILQVLAAAAATAMPMPATTAANTEDNGPEPGRYVESEHVRTFYRVNRYPR